MCQASPPNPVSEHSAHTDRGISPHWSLHLTPINFQQQLKCVRIQGQPKGHATCSCPGSHDHLSFNLSASFLDSIHGPLAHLSLQDELKNSVLQDPKITASTSAFLMFSWCKYTYFPGTVCNHILISMSCWNFMPSKNGPPNQPLHQNLLPSQLLT